MLLGRSSDALDHDVDLAGVVGTADAGIPAADELAAFAEAAHRRGPELADVRATLEARLGVDAVRDAAMTVAIFRSLNIAADVSGIPVDDDWHDHAKTFVGELGLDRFPTAANTPDL